MNRPCYQCNKRYVGCHSTCDGYATFCKEKQDILKKKQQEYDVRSYEILKHLTLKPQTGKRRR